MKNVILLAASLILMSAGVFGAGGDMGGTSQNGLEGSPYLIEDMADFAVFADLIARLLYISPPYFVFMLFQALIHWQCGVNFSRPGQDAATQVIQFAQIIPHFREHLDHVSAADASAT